ncbi:MAG: hypothetical protein AAGC43_11535 [Bacteroidota bacterium]
MLLEVKRNSKEEEQNYACFIKGNPNEYFLYDYWDIEEDGVKYLMIRIDQEDISIKLMKKYKLFIFKLNEEPRKLIFDYVKSGVFAEPNENFFIENYNEFYKKLSKCEQTITLFPETIVDELKLVFNNVKAKEKIKKLYEEIANEKEKIVNSFPDNIKLNNSTITELIRFISLVDKEEVSKNSFDSKKMLDVLYSLRELDKTDFNAIIIGKKSIQGDFNNKVDVLSNNHSEFSKLWKVVFLYEALIEDEISESFILFLKTITSILETNLKAEKEIIKKNYEIETIVDEARKNNKGEYIYIYPELISQNNDFDTYILSFKDRIKLKFTPDVGLVNYGFQNGFNEVSPYLGFHFNLSYLDKDIPFSSISNKNIWDYLSINLGWAFNSIEEEGKREGLIENGSLMTGLGVRINHTFRITLGKNWFYKLDENPISNNRSITSSNYVGLSIDFEVKDLLNGFSNVFKNE